MFKLHNCLKSLFRREKVRIRASSSTAAYHDKIMILTFKKETQKMKTRSSKLSILLKIFPKNDLGVI